MGSQEEPLGDLQRGAALGRGERDLELARGEPLGQADARREQRAPRREDAASSALGPRLGPQALERLERAGQDPAAVLRATGVDQPGAVEELRARLLERSPRLAAAAQRLGEPEIE